MNREIRHTNHAGLSFGAGLVGTQEQFSPASGTSANTSLEGLLAMKWAAFRFDGPKLDFGPSEESASRNDHVATLTIGWSHRR